MKLSHRPTTGRLLTEQNTSLNPLLKKLFAARHIHHATELQADLKQLLPISSLGNINAATTLLADSIEQQHTIVIIGDFDADGATASAVAIRALRLLDHTNNHFLVPNRFEYGYGLTPEIVSLASKFSPDLIITVDNGISSIEGVKAAKQAGYKVLVTDHHLAGRTLPEADVIVNPNLANDPFSSKNLAGVGVIFYVMLALKKTLTERGYFTRKDIKPPNLLSLLDLVALGTVADVVPLDQNNRILVEQGLRRIRAQQGCAGINALFQISGKNSLRAITADFAFACAPRLNAAGRLDDMSIGIELLLCDQPQEAVRIATTLDALNKERRTIENSMKAEAMQALEHLTLVTDQEIPAIFCLYHETWHQGVIGILASRIKEKFHRPTIVFAPADNNGINGINEIKGSARSITGLHIRDIIDEVATQNPQLLSKFGGHAMAAGLSLEKQHLDTFRQAINKVVLEHSTADTFEEIHYTDGQLAADDFRLETAELLRNAAPWGQHFPEPQFHGDFIIVQKRILKDAHIKLSLKPVNSNPNSNNDNQILSAIAFNVDLSQWPEQGEIISILYRLDVNEYRGALTLQLMISTLLS